MTLLMVVGIIVVVALPVAALVGLPIAQGVTAVVTNAVLLVVGGILGALGALVTLVAAALGSLLGSIVTTPSALPVASPPPAGPRPTPAPMPGTGMTFDVVGPLLPVLVLASLLGAAWYLTVRWQGSRDDALAPDRIVERRSIMFDLRIGLPGVARRVSQLRPTGAPSGALEAYPRLLHDWAAPHPLARRLSETPAAHAARLRVDGRGDLGLELLVADYELAHFGGVRLSAREHGRAVERWRRLRARG